jgi:hypothetical protein
MCIILIYILSFDFSIALVARLIFSGRFNASFRKIFNTILSSEMVRSDDMS